MTDAAGHRNGAVAVHVRAAARHPGVVIPGASARQTLLHEENSQ